jgi:hypothetical protein
MLYAVGRRKAVFMRKSIKVIRQLSIALWAAIAVPIAACQPQNVAPVNKTAGGVAIKGYDPVAYFLDGKPVKGSDEFTVWKFSGAGHRDLFAGDPEKYAPRYGGYCAFAVSIGRIADIDPESWTIVDGKLYLNLDKKTKKLWEQDMPGNIRKGDENWPRLLKGGR